MLWENREEGVGGHGKRSTKQPPIISPLFNLSMDFSILLLIVIVSIVGVSLHLVRALPFPNYTHSSTFSPSNLLYFQLYAVIHLLSVCFLYGGYVTGRFGTCVIWIYCCVCMRECVYFRLRHWQQLSWNILNTRHEYTSLTFYLARLFYCWLVLVAII